MTDDEVMAKIAHPAYTDMQAKGDAGIVAIMRLFYTHAILADMSLAGYGDRWCYASYKAAKTALDAWDGSGEPTGWHRHPDTGRRTASDGTTYVER